MSSSFLRARAPFLSALTLLLVALGPASCGQQGKVTSASTGTSTTMGGEGGTGGSGGSGGTTTTGTGGAEVAKALKVLNWNLHNMFDTQDDPNFTDDFALTQSEYDQKLSQIGAIIKEMDPDMAVLPEIESQAILDEMNTKYLAGAYTTAITLSNDFRGLDIGILSKLPIVDLVTHVDDSFKRLDLVGGQLYKYSRDAVEVHVNYNGREFILLGVHYRSKGTGMAETDDKDKRMAEAQHTRAIADTLAKEDPKRAILILGDFNDLPGSPPVNWTLQGDPANDPKIPFSATSDGLADADKYTFVYNGNKELIDHQMANPLLGPMLDKTSVTVRHGADVDAVSDHSPMMATYQIQ